MFNLHRFTLAAAGLIALAVITVSAQTVAPSQAPPKPTPPATATAQATPGQPPAGQAPAGRAATTPAAPAAPRQSPRAQVPMDPDRARQLYVSKDPKDQSLGTNYQRDIDARVAAEGRYPELCKGIIDYKKVSYRSSVGDMDIPAYLFQPVEKRGAKGHAALVWVHGGVHGNWGITMFPFVKEAVARGYVVIAPDYRGSTGYGEAHH